MQQTSQLFVSRTRRSPRCRQLLCLPKNDRDEAKKLNSYTIFDSETIDDEVEKEIIKTLDDNMPSDLEIRMRIMGFTPLTVAGYCLLYTSDAADE